MPSQLKSKISKFLLLLSFTLIFINKPIFSQDNSSSTSREATDAEAAEDQTNSDKATSTSGLESTRESLSLASSITVKVGKVDIQVKGITNRHTISRLLHIEEGKEYANLEALRRYLDRKFDSLRATGYFKKQGGVVYDLELAEQNSSIALINITGHFDTAWTIYPLVFPAYSTASGYGANFRLKWDNFLGQLTNVTFSLDLNQDRSSPYKLDVNARVSTSTFKLTPWFGINASLFHNIESNTTSQNWNTGFSVGTSFDLPILRDYVSTSYSASTGLNVRYLYRGSPTTHSHFGTYFSHSFGLSNTQSTSGGVFTSGYSLSLSNSFNFDNDPGSLSGSQAFAFEGLNIGFSMKAAKHYFDFINFKGRFGVAFAADWSNGVYNPNGYNIGASSYNRGIRSGKASGNFAAYLNMNIALLVFSDRYVGDIVLEPFFDVVWLNGPSGFSLEAGELGTGFDLTYIFHSLKIRFTYGIDLKQPNVYTIGISTGYYF